MLVNVKVAFIRPQYDNLERWCADSQNVYIGRKGIVFVPDNFGGKSRYPPKDSIWANPFKVKDERQRLDCIDQYEEYIRERLDNEPELVEELLQLEGKTLGCWCTPKSCHGHVLLKLIAEYSKKSSV